MLGWSYSQSLELGCFSWLVLGLGLDFVQRGVVQLELQMVEGLQLQQLWLWLELWLRLELQLQLQPELHLGFPEGFQCLTWLL